MVELTGADPAERSLCLLQITEQGGANGGYGETLRAHVPLVNGEGYFFVANLAAANEAHNHEGDPLNYSASSLPSTSATYPATWTRRGCARCWASHLRPSVFTPSLVLYGNAVRKHRHLVGVPPASQIEADYLRLGFRVRRGELELQAVDPWKNQMALRERCNLQI